MSAPVATNLKETLLEPDASAAETAGGTVALLPQEEREIRYLMKMLDERAIRRCLWHALATVASEMALDHKDAEQYLDDLLKNLKTEIILDSNGSLQVTGNAAPTLALLCQVISHAPSGIFPDGTFPSEQTLKKCLQMFHSKMSSKLGPGH